MKKILSVAIVLLSGNAFAAGGYGAAGCGLGSLVFGSKPGMIQVLAATTNGTFGSQTFGITSGTSNCTGGDKSAAVENQTNYVVSNMGSLSKDMARGSGATLEGFAATLGCSAESLTEVGATLQSNHGKIFANPGAVAVLGASKDALKANKIAASGCSQLI